MSEYLNQLVNAHNSNKSDEFVANTPEPQPTPEKVENNFLGQSIGLGVEIGGGMALGKYGKRALQTVRAARAASVAGAVAPEPTTTAGGLIGLAATEAAAWGLSNLLGQQVRKGFGIQDNISAGEALGASVFGTALAAKGVNKVLTLGGGLAQNKMWGKGNTLIVNGVEKFVNGATLGIAETAMRQEVQMLLNEREERDFNEYVTAGVIGGSFNTVLDAFGRSKSGVAKAHKVTQKAKARVQAQVDELNARADELKAKGNTRGAAKLRRQARETAKAIELIDDLGNKINTPKEAPEASATNAKPKEAPTEAPEAPTEAPTFTSKREDIVELTGRVKGLNDKNLSREMPKIERDASKIYDELYDQISLRVRKLTEADDAEARSELLELVRDLRALNKDVKDVVETTAGRTLRAARRGASADFAEAYSIRSIREDGQWNLLQDTLERYDDEVADAVTVRDLDELAPEEAVEALKTRLGKNTPADLPNAPEEALAVLRKRLDEVNGDAKNKTDNKRAQLLGDIEDAIYKSLETDSSGPLTKTYNFFAKSRQLALINQLPSGFAGVVTGVGALVREAQRGVGSYIAAGGGSRAAKIAAIETQEAVKAIFSIFGKDNRKAFVRTVKENTSATDNRAGRMEEDLSRGPKTPRGDAALVARARRRAEKAAKAKGDIITRASEQSGVLGSANRLYWLIQSGGGRLIQGIDEVFKRTLIKSRVNASARTRALNELEDIGLDYTDADLDSLSQRYYDEAWIEKDGLDVLRNNHEYIEEADLARRELLFAANSDNVDEVITPYSEKVINMLQELAGDNSGFGAALNAIMPYIGVPIRAVTKGVGVTTAPVRAALQAFGFANPYTKKIKELKGNLDATQKVKSEGNSFDDIISTQLSVEDELGEQIARMEARRIQYNADTISDAIMAIEAFGLAGALAFKSGAATGSLSFITDDAKEKAGLSGEQYKLMGMDYKAIGPLAIPFAVAADIGTYYRLRQIEARTGQKLIKDNVDWRDVVLNAVMGIGKDQPLSQGIDQITKILGSDEQRAAAATSMAGGYTPVPAFARKLVNEATQGDRKVDLKNATVLERLGYSMAGLEATNFKTDRFGNDQIDNRGLIQKHVMRQFPQGSPERDAIDEVIGTDTEGVIRNKPTTLAPNVSLGDFREQGGRLSLDYAFNVELSKFKLNNKTLEQAIAAKIRQQAWKKKFKNSGVGEANEGLKELDKLFQKYYEGVKQKLAANKRFTNKFVNKDDTTLTEVLEKAQEKRAKSRPVDLGALFQ